MIDEAKVAEMRKLQSYNAPFRDILETLEAALAVVRAAEETLKIQEDVGMYIKPETGERTEYQRGWNEGVVACNIDALEEALAPFRSEEKRR